MEWTITEKDILLRDFSGVEGLIERMDKELRGGGTPIEVTVQTWWVELVESCRKSKGGPFCGYVKPALWTRALT